MNQPVMLKAVYVWGNLKSPQIIPVIVSSHRSIPQSLMQMEGRTLDNKEVVIELMNLKT